MVHCRTFAEEGEGVEGGGVLAGGKDGGQPEAAGELLAHGGVVGEEGDQPRELKVRPL
jgi:hypothetical protein